MTTILRLMRSLLAALCLALGASATSAQPLTFTLGQFFNTNDPKLNAVAFDVYLPASSPWGNQKPALLFIPGGAFGTANKQEVAIYCQAYANMGYVAICTSYRTAPASPWPAQIQDVQSVLRLIRANATLLGINKNRVAAIGMSAGGMLAGLLGSVDLPDASGNSSKAQFVISVSGPWDLSKVLLDFHAINFGLPNPQAATPPAGYADFSALGTVANLFGVTNLTATFTNAALTLELFQKAQAASPITFISGTSSPTVLLHGTADTVVPPVQSDLAFAKLQQAGVPSWKHLFSGVGHAPSVDMIGTMHNYIVGWTQLTQ